MIFAFQPVFHWREGKIGNLRTAHSDTSADGPYLEHHTCDFPPTAELLSYPLLASSLNSVCFTHICVHACVQSR